MTQLKQLVIYEEYITLELSMVVVEQLVVFKLFFRGICHPSK